MGCEQSYDKMGRTAQVGPEISIFDHLFLNQVIN